MNRINQTLLAVLIAVFFAACGGSTSSNIVLKLGHGMPASHPVHFGLVRLNEELTALSGGKMTIDVYSSEQLGAEGQLLELLQIGSIDITKVSAASLESFVEPFKLFGIPYLFHSQQHYANVLSSDVGQRILDSTTPYWIKGLGYFNSGPRSFYTTNRPVNAPSDLKGLKIRVMKSPIATEMVEQLGGSPTPIDWGELYTALQSNVVDGAENNTPSIISAFHHEVAKYYTITEHTFSPDVVIISKRRWDSLNEEQRGWVKEATRRACIYENELWQEQEEKSMKMVKDKGVEIIYPDKAPFIEAAQPMIERYAKKPQFKEYIEDINNIN